ncbi:uncharacterized protein A4U43_UnF9010 [Asparagus officinalis]|uniref:Uncharacterized protein n=1 Tax=Asparagus officinalis TaxID=4686 RepID=A0A1R3L5S4_ASPOF|nr:uncharacterized protein A4U43_UnF9010 [Asparagus officinalis]
MIDNRGFFIEIDGEGGGGSSGGLRGDNVHGGGADHKTLDEELRAVGEGDGDLEGAPELFIRWNPPLLPHLHSISVVKIEARPDRRHLHRHPLPHRDDPPPPDPSPTPLHMHSPAALVQFLVWVTLTVFWSPFQPPPPSAPPLGSLKKSQSSTPSARSSPPQSISRAALLLRLHNKSHIDHDRLHVPKSQMQHRIRYRRAPNVDINLQIVLPYGSDTSAPSPANKQHSSPPPPSQSTTP